VLTGRLLLFHTEVSYSSSARFFSALSFSGHLHLLETLFALLDDATHTEPSKMSSPKPIYVINNFRNHVLTLHDRSLPSGVVTNITGFKGKDQIKGDEQKWIPEFGEEPDTVALKSVANGKYLNVRKENSGADAADTGEKLWWKMSRDGVNIPDSFRLSAIASHDPKKTALQCTNGSSDSKVSVYLFDVCLLLDMLRYDLALINLL
jgi:hypothetical protein